MEEEKEKYAQKKSNDYSKGEFERYLVSVLKWRRLLSFGLLGYTLAVFWLKGFIPTMFESSPVIFPVQSYRVLVL